MAINNTKIFEVLTKDGWLEHSKLSKETKILQLRKSSITSLVWQSSKILNKTFNFNNFFCLDAKLEGSSIVSYPYLVGLYLTNGWFSSCYCYLTLPSKFLSKAIRALNSENSAYTVFFVKNGQAIIRIEDSLLNAHLSCHINRKIDYKFLDWSYECRTKLLDGLIQTDCQFKERDLDVIQAICISLGKKSIIDRKNSTISVFEESTFNNQKINHSFKFAGDVLNQDIFIPVMRQKSSFSIITGIV